MNEKLGTEFTEDEAGFIALHFVNAEYNTTINDTFEMTNMIQKILELVRLEMGIEFDEESLHYERFITHLKFLVQRLYRHELLKDEEIEFARMMEISIRRNMNAVNILLNILKRNMAAELPARKSCFWRYI